VKNSSYWTEGAVCSVPATPLVESCDVLIIGGGFTGLSAALELARGGGTVVLLEKGKMGSGASTRNAGMTLAGLKLSADQLLQKYEKSLAVKLYRSSLEAIDYAEAFITAEKIDCEFKRHGALWAAYAPSHFSGFKNSQELLKTVFGHETEIIPLDRMKQELGTNYYFGGLIDPQSAGLHPGQLMKGLCDLAIKAKAKIYENTEVFKVTPQNRGFEVQHSKGVIKASEILLATNGYTPNFLTNFRRRVIPIGSYIMVTEPLSESVAKSLIPRGRMVFDTKKFLYYFRLTSDNRLLFGGRTSFAEISDNEGARILRESMLTVFPELHTAKTDFFWSGNVGFTFDQMPHLGKMDGIHYFLGCCGHGVAPGLYFGNAIAKSIKGQPIDIPFAQLPFQSRFFYRRTPWFLPMAGHFFKALDRISRG
jgi:glycine/D-amino acid oxidase-like deaminating enzyme